MSTEPENLNMQQQKALFVASRKKRNIAIGLSLITFIVALYLITMFKLGSQIFL